jgi:predicted type IV restriction endonuclease
LSKNEKFIKFLEEKGIQCFQKEEIQDELGTTAFRSYLEVEGQNLPVVVITDSSIYTVIRVLIAVKLVKKHNLNQVLDYCNELNRQYKVFKYYVTEEGDLCLDSCIVSTKETFTGDLVYTVIDVILKHLTEYYPLLMKRIWLTEKSENE